MTGRRYHDFVIFTEDPETDNKDRLSAFTVRVFQSPAGEGEREERVTIPDYNDLKKRRDRLARRKYDLNEQMMLGQRLAELLLPPYARQLFLRSLSQLGSDEGLRLRLRLLDQLALLPWEYMYLQETGVALPQEAGSKPTASRFLSLDPRISIMRHEAMAIAPQWAPPGDTRRIFIAMATPKPHNQYEPLDYLPEEQRLIKEALSKVEGVDVHCLPDYGGVADWKEIPGARPEDLQAEISKLDQVDIFHFSGHGDFETEMAEQFATYEGRGHIVLANEENTAVLVKGDHLAEMLREHGIRLVTLGACRTGMRDTFQAWSSVAAALLLGRIPSVVAMQFRVYDDFAAIFMAAVYEALVDGRTIDEAVFQGRAAIRASSYGERADARDWGTPVLYSRVPGGHIFPPVKNEHARQQAQKRIDSRSRLHQTWWEWMDHRATVSKSQLRLLAESGEPLELSSVQILLLLRSAVVEDTPTEPWLAALREQGADLMLQLDDPSAIEVTAYREESNILGLDETSPEGRPADVGSIAWTAVNHPDEATRQTAALALTALKPTPLEGLARLDRALGGLDSAWKRIRRKVELRGALADSDPQIDKHNAGLPPWDRLGIWLWRVGRRVTRQRDQIRSLVFGAAIGAGLALGILRGVQGIFAGPVFMSRFAISFFWAAILGAAVGLGVGLARPMLVRRREPNNNVPPFWQAPLHPGRHADLLAVMLGTLFFGIAHIAVAWFNSIPLIERAILIASSTLTGFGINLALYGQPKFSRGPRTASWFLRLAAAALMAMLAQWLIITAERAWPATAVTRTGAQLRDYFGRYENVFNLIDSNLDAFSYLDAAIFGILVTLGIAIGWQSLVKRPQRPPASDRQSTN
jgi:hypothetical protein